MHKIKFTTLSFIVLLGISLCAQESTATTIADLEAEVENLKSIEQSLRAQLESLRTLDSTIRRESRVLILNGFCLRYLAPVLSFGSGIWMIEEEFINGKYVYAIRGFKNPHQAYAISQQLRSIEKSRPQVVSIMPPPASSAARKNSSSMQIGD